MDAERFDLLETKLDALMEEVIGLRNSLKALREEMADLRGHAAFSAKSRQKSAASLNQQDDMTAQIMNMVEETNHKAAEIADQQKELQTQLLRLSAASHLHKRRLANLEEQVYLLQN